MIRSGIVGVVFGILSLAVILGVNLLFYRWATRRFPFFARHRRALLAVLAFVIVMGPLGRMLANAGDNDRFASFEAASTLWGLTLLGAIPLIYLVDLLFTRRFGVRRSGETIDRREALARVGGTIVLGAAAVPLARGIATRFDYDVVELPVRIPKLPRALDGFTMVQISDIHIGIYLGERELRWAEQSIADLRPDLVVMTGDLVHLRPSFLPLGCDWVRRLGERARYGSLSILGNHEYYVGRNDVVAAFARAKLDLLINQSRLVAGGIAVAGVDDVWSEKHGYRPDLDAALAPLPPDAPRILLAHQPQFHDISAAKVDLQLSGHTHGGQIAPFGPVAVSLLTRGRNAGLYRQGASSLYVNRGFGTSGPPSRVAVRPEITKIILVSG